MAKFYETEMLLELNKLMYQKEQISEEKYRRARESLLEEMCRLRGERKKNADD